MGEATGEKAVIVKDIQVQFLIEGLQAFGLACEQAAKSLESFLKHCPIKGFMLVRARLTNEFLSWGIPFEAANWLAWHLPYRLVGSMVRVIRHDAPPPARAKGWQNEKEEAAKSQAQILR